MRLPRRPSAAMLVALTALVVAMSGTAVAATGGMFILGKANKATTVTSLSNSKGTALSLSSHHGKPPLTVSDTTQVPQLNASLLDGQSASAFLGVDGTAVNADKLGGQSPSAYMMGDGQVSHSTFNIGFGGSDTLSLPNALSGDYDVKITCSNPSPGEALATVTVQGTTANDLEVWYLYPPNGVTDYTDLSDSSSPLTFDIAIPTTLDLQVAFDGHVVTTIVSVMGNAPLSCPYAAQSFSDGG